MTNKFFKNQLNLVALLMLLLSAGLYSCSEEITSEETTGTVAAVNHLKSVTLVPSTTTTNITVVPLLAGQTMTAGNVTIQTVLVNNVLSLNVTYNLTGGWAFQTTADALKLWVGTSLSDMPQNAQGQPKIGQFPYKLNATGTTATINIPLSEFGYESCSVLNLIVAAHADVIKGTQTQTAWAAGTKGSAKGSWWTWFAITVKNDAPVITGTLPDMVVNGCSATDVPAAVTTLDALKALNPTTPLVITDDSFGEPLGVTYVDGTVSGANSCDGYTIVRTYTVSDECSSATVTQKITVKDTEKPVLSGQGANGSVACTVVNLNFTAPTASDNCDENPVITPVVSSVTNSDGSISETTTWTAVDACGNVSDPVSQTITKEICPPTSGNCTAWTYDTGFGGSASGAGKAWWFYYDGVGQETIWAGKNKNAGYVEKVGENLVITLAPGWELSSVGFDDDGNQISISEPVKIQGYDELPGSRPAAGLFTTYKGTSLSVAVGDYPYYVIHLDLQKCATTNN